MAQELSPETILIARTIVKAMGEGLAEQVASFVARGMTPEAAERRAVAALRAACAQHRAHDEFLATLTADPE